MRSDLLSLHIDTQFKEVDRLFRQAFDVFVTDLQTLEGSLPPPSLANSDGSDGGNERASAVDRNADNQNGRESSSNDRAAEKKNCDIKRFNIGVVVSSSAAVHLTIDTDESYNLTMSSK